MSNTSDSGSSPLFRTPFFSRIQATGAKIVPFAGWEMAVTFTSLIEEHTTVRTKAGLFDISHMGRLEISGSESEALLSTVCTRNPVNVPKGRVRYSVICREDGGVIDDILIYRESETMFMLVVNAGNRDAVVEWILEQAEGMSVVMSDVTLDTCMLALQGPEAVELAETLLPHVPLSDMKYFSFMRTDSRFGDCLVSRTGYTGEDGVEITVSAEAAGELWDACTDTGIALIGLGARDTLRLEAGMPLYGHELSKEITPLQAGLQDAVNFDHDFIGKETLLKQKEEGLPSKRYGFKLDGRRIPREGFRIFSGGEDCGFVSSGTFSPTLQYPICMGYLKAGTPEDNLEIEIRKNRIPAEITELPFYTKP